MANGPPGVILCFFACRHISGACKPFLPHRRLPYDTDDTRGAAGPEARRARGDRRGVYIYIYGAEELIQSFVAKKDSERALLSYVLTLLKQPRAKKRNAKKRKKEKKRI